MANSSTSLEITSFRCIMENVTGTLDYMLTNYLQLKGMGVGNFVSSGVFRVAGYDWEIRFYPAGQNHNCAGNASCFVRYLSQAKDVSTKFSLSMTETNGQKQVVSHRTADRLFNPPPPTSDWGYGEFVDRSKLKSMSRLGDGCFTIRCVLTVSNDSPPLELPRDLKGMLRDGRGADVRFRVGRRKFRAHRSVLAARSPVFRAQLFGPMAEKNMRRVKVVGVEPSIFQMMLRYIYTDALPRCKDEAGYSAPVMQHLLVAADRYGLERLKQMCEEELSKRIDVDGVILTFALANQHHCNRLKDACTEFMKEVLAAVVETDEFKERFITSCQPLSLEWGALGTKRSSQEEQELDHSKKSKKMRTK